MRFLLALVLLVSTSAGAETLLVLGDSISAAHGIDKNQGWVALLEQRFQRECPQWQVKNVSVSGETSAGGRVRLDGLLDKQAFEAVLIELGGNDGLRGLPVDQLEANLTRMIERSRAAGARVGLLGIRIPPNYGAAYTELFEKTFRGVAQEQDLPFVARLLEGVGGEQRLMQDDGIHPTAEAQPELLENAWPVINAITECKPEEA